MNRQVDQLVDAIRLLASSPEVQLQHLTELGLPNGVDELALEFADVEVLAAGMRDRGELSEVQFEAVRLLSSHLERMSGADQAASWTAAALSEGREWAEVRRLAAEALARLAAPLSGESHQDSGRGTGEP